MNPARPAAGTPLAQLEDVPDGGAVIRDFALGEARFSLLICRRGDAIHAYENRCPHAGFPLERLDGAVITDREVLVCAAHGAIFQISDGACLGGPGRARGLTPVPTLVERGEILMG